MRLSALLEFSAGRKRELGIEHTPREIAQQPETWQSTLALCKRLQPELAGVFEEAGRAAGAAGGGGDLGFCWAVRRAVAGTVLAEACARSREHGAANRHG